jgi:Protein phosphatase 2C
MKSINYCPQFGVDATECPICKFPVLAGSKDHKPNQSEKRQRLEDAGGFVMWAGTSLILL